LMWQAGFVPTLPERISGTFEYVPLAWAGQCTENPQTLCQPNSLAEEICQRHVQGVPLGCDTCQPSQGVCDVDPDRRGSRMTIWELVVRINATRLAGHDDWRVPTIVELESIVDFGRSIPTLDSAFDDATCDRGCIETTGQQCSCNVLSYWSATSIAEESASAWHVSFWEGEVYGRSKHRPSSVRLVRNHQLGDQR
jgi:hypothetical protein